VNQEAILWIWGCSPVVELLPSMCNSEQEKKETMHLNFLSTSSMFLPIAQKLHKQEFRIKSF
jgi:hypothetical protein